MRCTSSHDTRASAFSDLLQASTPAVVAISLKVWKGHKVGRGSKVQLPADGKSKKVISAHCDRLSLISMWAGAHRGNCRDVHKSLGVRRNIVTADHRSTARSLNQKRWQISRPQAYRLARCRPSRSEFISHGRHDSDS